MNKMLAIPLYSLMFRSFSATSKWLRNIAIKTLVVLLHTRFCTKFNQSRKVYTE